MTIADAIEEFSHALAQLGGAVVHVDLDEKAYQQLMDEIGPTTAIDLHEVCGDYDRPSSPWYGARPGHFRTVGVWTAPGVVSIGKK